MVKTSRRKEELLRIINEQNQMMPNRNNYACPREASDGTLLAVSKPKTKASSEDRQNSGTSNPKEVVRAIRTNRISQRGVNIV